jgi:hypothetical protein
MHLTRRIEVERASGKKGYLQILHKIIPNLGSFLLFEADRSKRYYTRSE